MMAGKALRVSSGCDIPSDQIVMFRDYTGEAVKREKERAASDGRLMDACFGKSCQSIIDLRDGFVCLSPTDRVTLVNRFNKLCRETKQ